MAATYKLFSCEVLRDEVESLAARLSTRDAFDMEWLEMGLHEKPEKLRAELTKRIAGCSGKGYRAILLLFGLCSNATAGLSPPVDSLLVIPRVHDCISLYLGSARAYLDEHAAEAGTYWFSRGFLHRSDGRGPESCGLGAGLGFSIPGIPEGASPEEIRKGFTEQYGEENAEYLMETFLESWKKNYTRAVYLNWDGYSDSGADARHVAAFAADNGWRYEERRVNLRLVTALLGGPWPEDEFVVVRPGQRLAATHDARALAAEPVSSEGAA